MRLFEAKTPINRLTELPDERNRELRLALALFDVFPGSEGSDYFGPRAVQLAPAIHEFLAVRGLIDPVQQHFVGFKGPLELYRISPAHTHHHPYHTPDLFTRGNRLAREFLGLKPTPPQIEVVMPTDAVPTLLSVMIMEGEGLAGGGNGQPNKTRRLHQLVLDCLKQRNLVLPEVNPGIPGEVIESLGLQPIEPMF